MRRLLTGDTTQEALVELMARNRRGLMLFRDEHSGWFKGFNQYRQGGDRQFFLGCHAGGMHTKDRKLSGATIITDLYLNICGVLQPDVVSEALRGGEVDGMAARFSLLVWPDPIEEFTLVDRFPDCDAQSAMDRIMRTLFELTPAELWPTNFSLSPVLRFDDQAQGIFFEWYMSLRKRLHSRDLAPDLEAHLSKYPGLFAPLSIVLHLVRVADGTAQPRTRVGVETAERVRRFIDEYLEPHARRIYGHLGQDPARRGARRIAAWIYGKPGVTEFSAREIRQMNWAGLTSQDNVNLALDYLENVAGWVRCKEVLPGPKGGRPTTRYKVNPRVRENR